MYLEWLASAARLFRKLTSIFTPLIIIVNLIMGWLKCTKDDDGNVACSLFEQLDTFLKFLQDFPDLAVDWFLENIFGPLLPLMFNFELEWQVEWIRELREFRQVVRTMYTCMGWSNAESVPHNLIRCGAR